MSVCIDSQNCLVLSAGTDENYLYSIRPLRNEFVYVGLTKNTCANDNYFNILIIPLFQSIIIDLDFCCMCRRNTPKWWLFGNVIETEFKNGRSDVSYSTEFQEAWINASFLIYFHTLYVGTFIDTEVKSIYKFFLILKIVSLEVFENYYFAKFNNL